MNHDLDLADAIQELIADKLAVNIASEDSDLLTDGVLDSVTLIQLILHLEQRFNVQIDLSELEIDDLRTVRSIAQLLARLQMAGMCDDIVLAHAAAAER